MPPVGAAIAAIGAAVNTAFIAAGAAIGIGAGASLMAAQFFGQMIVGVALSAIGRALTPDPERPRPTGTQTQVRFGEDVPQTFVLGRYAVMGDLVFANSHGEVDDMPNGYYVQVFELSCLPATARRFFVNGEWVTLSATANAENGWYPAKQYREGDRDNLWIGFYDGTQTTADPHLVEIYGADKALPWDSDHVGVGLAYMIVHTRLNPKMHSGLPRVRAELDGWKFYDVRKDSTAGGSGAHRLGNPATWEPSDNPWVIIYNILLGIADPITGEHLWGGQDIRQGDLPFADWASAMTTADDMGYRAGVEVSTDMDPVDVIDELKKAAQGEIAEAAGWFIPRCGVANVSVFAFSDADLIVTEPDSLKPFPTLDATYTGIAASYPEPADGWESRDAPVRIDADAEAEDGGRRNIASLRYAAVWDKAQVQKLMKSALKDERRFRRHVVVLPPAARPLAPLDTVTWDSDVNGYIAKLFTVDAVEHMASGCVLVMLHETDPGDYDWTPETDLLPTDTGFVAKPVRGTAPTDFYVLPATILDAASGARKPAIELGWNPDKAGADAVRWQIRLRDNPDHTPSQGAHFERADDRDAEFLEFAPGVPLEFGPGEPIVFAYVSDVDLGKILISQGIEPAEIYELRARYYPVGKWSTWLEVTAPDVRIKETALETALASKINTAQAQANQALNDAASAATTADQALALATDAANATGVVGRLLPGGWLVDPSFDDWTLDDPDSWTVTAGAAHVTQDATGYFNATAARLAAPGSADVAIRARDSDLQMNTAVALDIDYIVVSVMLEYISGDLGAGRMKVEWQQSGTAVWTQGGFALTDSTTGALDELGFTTTTGQRQIREFLIARPAFTADDVQLLFYGGVAGDTAALTVIVHSLDIRAARAAEIDQINLRTFVEAEIVRVDTKYEGITDAQASTLTQLTATVGTNTAAISSEQTARANADSALSSRVDTVEAETDTLAASVSQIDIARADGDGALAARLVTVEATPADANLVKNGQFLDGARSAGMKPDSFETWPAAWSVAARGSGGSMNDCPGRFAVVMPYTASNADAVIFGNTDRTRVPVAAGDVFFLSMAYGGGSNGTIRFVISWYDATGAAIATTTVGPASFNVGGAWPVWTYELTAPASAATMKAVLRRPSGGSGTAYATTLSIKRVDPALQQRLTALIAFKASAGNPAELELVSVANNGLPGESVARIRADNILLDGSVAAKQLVVGDFSNLVPDSQLQSDISWADVTGSGEWQIIPNTARGGNLTKGEARWDRGGSTAAYPRLESQPFGVTGGEELLTSFKTLGDTGAYRSYMQLRFYDASEVLLDTISVGNVDRNASSGTTASGDIVITVPAGARTATCGLVINRSITSANAVRFWSPVVRRRVDGVLIKDGEITANHITISSLDALSANLGSIEVGSANIKNASIETLKVKNGAITRTDLATRDTVVALTSEDTWFDILAVTQAVDAQSFLAIFANYETDRTLRWISDVYNDSGVRIKTNEEVGYALSWRLRVEGSGFSNVNLAIRNYYHDIALDPLDYGSLIRFKTPNVFSPGVDTTVTVRLQAMARTPPGVIYWNGVSPPTWHDPKSKSQNGRTGPSDLTVLQFKR